MTKKLYPHFNPEVHKIESKIATVRTSHHCKYNFNYHIIWIPKYRKPILTGKVVEVLKAIIEGQCQEMSIQELALEVMPDHLHLFVGAKPTVTPFKIIHKLRKHLNTIKKMLSRIKISWLQTAFRQRF